MDLMIQTLKNLWKPNEIKHMQYEAQYLVATNKSPPLSFTHSEAKTKTSISNTQAIFSTHYTNAKGQTRHPGVAKLAAK